MEIGRIQQLTASPLTDTEAMFINLSDICEDTFDIYDYEDFLGIAHQIMAMELDLC